MVLQERAFAEVRSALPRLSLEQTQLNPAALATPTPSLQWARLAQPTPR